MRKIILFDLDGTLLPMDLEKFTSAYFQSLAKYLSKYGFESKKLINGVLLGTSAMVKNTGEKTNEMVFWETFKSIYNQEVDLSVFERFYQTEFQKISHTCGYNPEVPKLIQRLKEQGYTLILATNPIFPMIAQESRIRWAGLKKEDFVYITSYENSSYCKPNPLYYQQILEKNFCSGEDCIMIGNDVKEDMVAQALNLKVFLMTDYLINIENVDTSLFPQGGIKELEQYLQDLSTTEI